MLATVLVYNFPNPSDAARKFAKLIVEAVDQNVANLAKQ
jgi:hypothetical protein